MPRVTGSGARGRWGWQVPIESRSDAVLDAHVRRLAFSFVTTFLALIVIHQALN